MRIRLFPPLTSLGWPAWLATLAAFAVLCAIVAWWALLMLAPRPPIAPSVVSLDGQALPELRLAAQLFGSPAGARGPAIASTSNVTVVGVLSAGVRGSAILAVDGQPPRAYAVGERIGPTQVLSAVRGDTVVLDENGRRLELQAPQRPALSLLNDGPGRTPGLDPGFAPGQPGAPRIAMPLGAGAGGSGPRPALPVPLAPIAPPTAAPTPTMPAGLPGAPGIVPTLPPTPLAPLPGQGILAPAQPAGGIVPVVPEAAASLPGRGDD